MDFVLIGLSLLLCSSPVDLKMSSDNLERSVRRSAMLPMPPAADRAISFVFVPS